MSSPQHPTGFGLDSAQRRVRDFHAAMGHPTRTVPGLLAPDRVAHRSAWMREEIDEFEVATTLVDQADAMIDLIYFALGTLVELGVDGEELFEVVHRANMAKLGPDGTIVRGPDGKIRKPPGWVSPEERIAETLVARYSDFELVRAAGAGGPVPAALAMAARALGSREYALDAYAGLAPAYGDSFDPELAGAGLPLRDDYLSIEDVSPTVFASVVRAATGRDAVVGVGFDGGLAYRHPAGAARSSPPAPARFGLVAAVTDDTVLLVDPGPERAGLHGVPVDDLVAAVRAGKDGIHRLRRVTPES